MHAHKIHINQTGASLVEFSIIAIPLLGLLLGGLELSQWYFTRQAISLALLEAGRSVITNHNHPEKIIEVFERELLPLYTSANNNAKLRLESALKQRVQDNQLPPWQIKVLSPSSSAFIDFNDISIQTHSFNGLRAINNNYLDIQHQNNIKLGQGLGKTSNQDIYQANTLVLSLTWQHKPVLPLIKPILKLMGNANGNYKQISLYSGYLPIQREISLMMHSHPVQWHSDPSNKVIFDWDSKSAYCKGWLCNLKISTTNNQSNLDTNLPSFDSSHNADNTDSRGTNSSSNSGNQNNADDTTNNRENSNKTDDLDDLCGTVLCCVDWD